MHDRDDNQLFILGTEQNAEWERSNQATTNARLNRAIHQWVNPNSIERILH